MEKSMVRHRGTGLAGSSIAYGHGQRRFGRLGSWPGQSLYYTGFPDRFYFAAICEEFGILVGGMVIGFYALIIIRSMHKASMAHNPEDMLLACGSAVSLAVQAFIIIGGVVKMIPLTGITLPL